MKNYLQFRNLIIALLITTLCSCSALGSLFKAGVNTGIFIAVAVGIAILLVIFKLKRR